MVILEGFVSVYQYDRLYNTEFKVTNSTTISGFTESQPLKDEGNFTGCLSILRAVVLKLECAPFVKTRITSPSLSPTISEFVCLG